MFISIAYYKKSCNEWFIGEIQKFRHHDDHVKQIYQINLCVATHPQEQRTAAKTTERHIANLYRFYMRTQPIFFYPIDNRSATCYPLIRVQHALRLKEVRL